MAHTRASTNTKQSFDTHKLARYIFFGLLAYVPLHIFLSTWIGTSYYILDFAKIAKELVLVFGFALTLGLSVRQSWFKPLLRHKLIWVILAYAGLHLLLALIRPTDQTAELLALAYNTRFLVFFLYAILLAHHSNGPHLIKRSLQVVFAVSLIVMLFGILQYSVLPHNTLERFGYSRANGVLPAFFIDDKIDFPRVMSTIRDPNSYGSYLLIIIALAASYLRIVRHYGSRYMLIGVLGLAIMNLLLTFSRSAWLGFSVVVAVLVFFEIKRGHFRKVSRETKLITTVSLIALSIVAAGSLYAIRDSYSFRNIFFHADESTVLETPNQLRLRFWRESIDDTAANPAGYGPGTAGLTSIRNQEQGTVLNENYYLQIAYEVGVIGLALFLLILLMTAVPLWRQAERIPVALGLIASFAGLAVTNLLVHIWSNEAVAYTWWGLAGLVVATTLATTPPVVPETTHPRPVHSKATKASTRKKKPSKQ
jgi:putative inorganic carbon (hco3(-)) transporter